MNAEDLPISACSGRLENTIRAGRFAIVSEITAPRAPDPERVRQKADHLIGCVDAINVTDNQGANVHMAPWAVSLLVLEQGGEPILTYTTRDRNRLALQSDFIGAAALGIKNIFVMSGDPIGTGRHAMASQVSDVDPAHVLQILRRMRNPGILDSGEELRDSTKEPVLPTRFFVGAAVNPLFDSVDQRHPRLTEKIDAGADFVQTQCLFDIGAFRDYMTEIRNLGLHERTAILAGILVPRSLKMLEFFAERVPGVVIPEPFFKRMQRAEDQNRAIEQGIDIAAELIRQCREIPGLRGIHLITAGREDLCRPVLERSGFS